MAEADQRVSPKVPQTVGAIQRSCS